MESNTILRQYMVEFDVPYPLTDEFLDLITDQKSAIDELFISGKMLSYTVSLDRKKVWAIFLADEESELVTYIDYLPMTGYMDYNYREIMFHNTVHLMPAMSLN